MNSRQAAFEALLAWQQKGTFLWDSIQEWKEGEKPEKRELDFAYELACQTCRLFGYLEYAAKKIATSRPKKLKERLLLYMGLYQRIFLKNIPIYAVVDSTVELSKLYCSDAVSRFLNAVLRKEVPTDSPSVIAEHSFPDFFKQQLRIQYGDEIPLLLQLNTPSKKMATTFENGIVSRVYDEYPAHCYIQNCTPVKLVTSFAQLIKPKKILDLCAAPGGKTILISHLFPEALIQANDLAHKLPMLKENLQKFAPNVKVSSQFDQYDLILVDAPCSNSGVLYKCPEARARLTNESLQQLEGLQLSLIEKAIQHLAPGGMIWYMTCSILRQENEAFVAKLTDLKLVQSLLLLPDGSGQEGGFCAALTTK